MEDGFVRAMGHVAETLARQAVLVGDVVAVLGILGDEQVGPAQAAALQPEEQRAGGRVGSDKAALFGHEMQRHEDVERHRFAATVSQTAAEVGVELAGVADQHHVVVGRGGVGADEAAIGPGDAPPEARVTPAAAGLLHAILDAMPEGYVADVDGHVRLGL